MASLASVRRPEDLGLVLLARPHILPAELGKLPHVLVDPVDSSDPAGVERTLMSVRQELDRRVAAGAREDAPDLVVVARELADLQAESCNQLVAIAAAGPSVKIRVIAASERPVHDVNPDTVTLPPKLDRLLQDIRLRLSDPTSSLVGRAMMAKDAAHQLGHVHCCADAPHRAKDVVAAGDRARVEGPGGPEVPIFW